MKRYYIAIASLLIFTVMSQTKVRAGKFSDFRQSDVLKVEITAERLNVRSGPGMEFDVIQSVSKGYVVDVIGEMDNWFAVHLPDNSIGVVSKEFAKSYKMKTTETAAEATNEGADDTPAEASTAGSEVSSILALINNERKAQKIPALEIDSELSRAAQLKAEEMAKTGILSHNSPTFGSPYDMLKQMGVTYKSIGENIVGNKSLEGAHKQIMLSKSHCANIINPRYNKLGLAVVSDEKYGKIIVQLFAEK